MVPYRGLHGLVGDPLTGSLSAYATEAHAFDLLRRSSQRLNVKLRETAQKLTETGELDGPDRP